MNGVEERVLYFYFQSVHDDQSVKQDLFKEFYDDDFRKVPVLDSICYTKKPILIDEEPQQYDFTINEAFRSVLDNAERLFIERQAKPFRPFYHITRISAFVRTRSNEYVREAPADVASAHPNL